MFSGFSGEIGGWGKKIVTYVLENDNAEFHFDGGYWQTVMVCQLKVIGSPLRSAN